MRKRPTGLSPYRRLLSWFRRIAIYAVLIPLAISSVWRYAHGWPASWRAADWSSARILPNPRVDKDAVVLVYAARTGRWKGIFSVHCWLVVKARNAPSYTRYEVVGWGNPVRRNAYAPDARWYSNTPYLVHQIRGERAQNLIPEIEAAIARYPARARGTYTVWPGPNSNTFIAWIARQVPQLELEMPANAVGKDYLGKGVHVSSTPSGTGWQVSYSGYAGFAIGLSEGIELHVAGTTIGFDPDDLAIKLPGLGSLGLGSLGAAKETL